MSRYSVADAKAHLPRLIDKTMAGEEVIITRHGKPMVELRPATVARSVTGRVSLDWFLSGRIKPMGEAPTSVELLNLIYDEPNA